MWRRPGHRLLPAASLMTDPTNIQSCSNIHMAVAWFTTSSWCSYSGYPSTRRMYQIDMHWCLDNTKWWLKSGLSKQDELIGHVTVLSTFLKPTAKADVHKTNTISIDAWAIIIYAAMCCSSWNQLSDQNLLCHRETCHTHSVCAAIEYRGSNFYRFFFSIPTWSA